ncbi:phosphoglycolate phosphatase 2 isoform X1 [Lactuca sativa]|uniref:phosphoglycolate phosphatase 2 isoform X1 n=1 Tax=Lactuca sativa TaxID=4236 RepID=UPI000CD9DA13|nr:phosphoglycolate phosphatase 2 isoform X1 [Lactuca sativa]
MHLQEEGTKTIHLKVTTLFEHDKNIGAVVVRHDTNVNYEKIQYATLCIHENPRCIFIATNSGIIINMTDLQEWPGTKSTIQSKLKHETPLF